MFTGECAWRRIVRSRYVVITLRCVALSCVNACVRCVAMWHALCCVHALHSMNAVGSRLTEGPR